MTDDFMPSEPLRRLREICANGEPIAAVERPAARVWDLTPERIVTDADAVAALTHLHRHGIAWHPDDDPREIGNGDGQGNGWVPLFSDREAAHAERVMAAIFATDVDPYAILLDLLHADGSIAER